MFSFDRCKLCNLQGQKDGEWVYIQLECGARDGSVLKTIMEDKNMPKLAILAGGLAVLVSLWVIGTKVGTAGSGVIAWIRAFRPAPQKALQALL